MKIETKYDIGQEVWMWMHGCVATGNIVSVEIARYKGELTIYYNVMTKTNTVYDRLESNISPTKEELLKSL